MKKIHTTQAILNRLKKVLHVDKWSQCLQGRALSPKREHHFPPKELVLKVIKIINTSNDY